MPDERVQAILDNIVTHDQITEKVQFLVYHLAVQDQEAFDRLTVQFEGRVELDRTIVIVSGIDPLKDDERIYLYCHVSRDLEGAYNRQVIVDKIADAYQRHLARPAGTRRFDNLAAVRRTFGPDFVQLFDDNNMMN